MSTKTLIIGIGNDLRKDDAVGLVVARELRNRVPSGVEVVEHHGDGTVLVTLWHGVDRVIVIDAMNSGADAGTIQRIDALAKPLPQSLSFSSTHSFGFEEAVELAGQLGYLPEKLVVFGIEGGSFGIGSGLSAKVREAAGLVVEKILQELA